MDLKIKKFTVVEVNAITDGQASSALLAGNYLNDNDEVAIFNIDTYIEPNILQKQNLKKR